MIDDCRELNWSDFGGTAAVAVFLFGRFSSSFYEIAGTVKLGHSAYLMICDCFIEAIRCEFYVVISLGLSLLSFFSFDYILILCDHWFLVGF